MQREMFKTASSWEINFSFFSEKSYLYWKVIVDEHFVEDESCERIVQPQILFVLCMCIEFERKNKTKQNPTCFISAKISHK